MEANNEVRFSTSFNPPFQPATSSMPFASQFKDKVKEVASTFLGCISDRSGSSPFNIGENVLDIPSDSSHINVYTSLLKQHYVITDSLDQLLSESRQKLKGKFSEFFPSPGFSNPLPPTTNSLFISLTHINFQECSLNQSLKIKAPIAAKEGQFLFIEKGWVYTGYRIFIFIHCEEPEHSNASSPPTFFEKNEEENFSDTLLNELAQKLGGKNIIQIEIKSEITSFNLDPVLDNILTINQLPLRLKLLHETYIHQLSQDALTPLFSFSPEKCLLGRGLAAFTPPLDIPVTDFLSLSQTIPLENLEGGRGFQEMLEKSNTDLARMLRSIDSVFSSVFIEKESVSRLEEDSVSYKETDTLVMGPSHSGKSTLVGYLSGATIKRDHVEEVGEERAVYATQNPLAPYPAQGHEGSKTKGASSYKNYLDTGGFIDSRGISEDICNSLAISMLASNSSLRYLIILLPFSYYTDDHCTKFLEVIQKIKKILIFQPNQETFPQLIFLLNAKMVEKWDNETISRYQKAVVTAINGAINFKKDDLEVDFGTDQIDNVWAYITQPTIPNSSKEKKFFEKIKSKLDKEKACKLDRYREEYQILKYVKEKFLIIDFYEGSTREKIEGLMPPKPKKPLLDLKMENLIDNGLYLFKNTLLYLAVHFNACCDALKTNEQELRKKFTNIISKKEEVFELKKRLRAVSEKEREASFQTLLAIHQNQLENLNEDFRQTADQIANLEKMITNLEEDETEEEKKLEAIPSITARSIFAYKLWATKYTIKHTSQERFIRAEPFNPHQREGGTFNITWPGVFIPVQEDPEKGIYEIKYLPAWYGYKEDESAHVKIYIKKNHLIETNLQIQGYKTNLGTPQLGLIGKKELLTISIQEKCSCIDKLSLRVQTKENDQASLAEAKKKLVALTIERDDLIMKLTANSLNLHKYKKFYELISKITIAFNMNSLPSENQARIFISFQNQVLEQFPRKINV